MAVSRKGIPDGSRRLVPRKASARSRVSNAADILPDVDGRSAVARRYRDIAAQIIADMGGASQCDEARLQLIRRFAAAAVLAEQMEARLANGHSINITDHALLSSTLVRLAGSVRDGQPRARLRRPPRTDMPLRNRTPRTAAAYPRRTRCPDKPCGQADNKTDPWRIGQTRTPTRSPLKT